MCHKKITFNLSEETIMRHQKSILIVILVLLVAMLPASVLAQGGGEDYIVQAGDTLSKIAEAAAFTPSHCEKSGIVCGLIEAR